MGSKKDWKGLCHNSGFDTAFLFFHVQDLLALGLQAEPHSSRGLPAARRGWQGHPDQERGEASPVNIQKRDQEDAGR